MNTEERQKLIKEASQKYYSNGTSPLTDAEFDALIEEERAENPNSPLLGIGHGYDVNLTSGQKVQHRYGAVGSLPKCHNWNEFPKALKDIKVSITLKLDGLSCAMYYRNGVLCQALTRGDGQIGIDITDKIYKIVPDYVTIPDKTFTGAVRGEILMPLDRFEAYTKLHEDAKNPRNTTAGLINAKELSKDLEYLTVILYTVIGIETTQTYPFPLYPFTDYYSMHEWLVDNFGCDNVVHIGKNIFEYETEFMDYMNYRRNIWYGEYPADGIVITSNDIEFDAHNVKTGAYIKYNASAFKFKAESAITTVTGIEWNLSKTKYLIPVIQVEPTQLSGTTVKRCSGNNAKMVIDNKWGIGAKIRITKSGEIIPYIEETILPSYPEYPLACPSCGEELVWEGVHLKCPNPDCKDMQVQDLLVWCNNIAPVEGLGDTLKIKFFEELHTNHIKDGFHKQFDISIEGVYDYNETIVAKGTQEKLFFQMLYGLKHNKVSIISALKALNIPRLGDATADLLSHYKEDIDSLVNGVMPDKLAYKIGNANADSIQKHIHKFERLKYIYSNIEFPDEYTSTPRIKVAITGSLSIPRKQFESLLNANGFALGDVTKDTKYLITEDPNSNSGKNAKADKLGIEKITEEDFRAKFGF